MNSSARQGGFYLQKKSAFQQSRQYKQNGGKHMQYFLYVNCEAFLLWDEQVAR